MKIILLSLFVSLVATPIYAFSDAVEALIEVGEIGDRHLLIFF